MNLKRKKRTSDIAFNLFEFEKCERHKAVRREPFGRTSNLSTEIIRFSCQSSAALKSVKSVYQRDTRRKYLDIFKIPKRIRYIRDSLF